ncbi:FtsH protease activity modulator HflK [Alcanivorax marinus]|uniref:Protein HflK n=1 Tax=Alloalcanivorax marinus TaxID=1177169 RepID=A0A9Q3YLI1_9GAMM|nr:FtsH protease activity modulator HflK [Alloalcanivorax marinus]MBM7332945.1 FtsH protease activity modulator HflK [Alloalcanivorax marinus]MCC4307829.1 FtsH protease activity modulator HflK [Alloalcanivorax marinus]MCU5788221.1 protease subunit HflK [Alloalcanivorax marinus]
MAWNEPGGNKPRDPWGGGGGGGDQRPPDLDEALKNLKDRINNLFGGKSGGGGGGKKPSGGFPGGLLAVVLIILAVGYVLMGFYVVDQSQRAVVLRFGEFNRMVDPGLNWRAPIIEQSMKVDVGQNRSYELSEEMLTEDTNIVAVTLEVQYKVLDPQAYLLRVGAPEAILEHATSSALRHVVGSSTMDGVLKDRREDIRLEVRERLQDYLDRYNTGLVINQVVLDKTAAPEAVRDAFDDVAKAKEDEDRFKKEAEAYYNSVIPQARGQGARVEAEADAYKARVVAEAQGDAARFNDMVTEYRKAPEVTRQRLYLQTVSEVLSNSSKVLADIPNGDSLMYLPLDQMLKGRAGKSSGQSGDAGKAGGNLDPSSAGADDGGGSRQAPRSLYQSNRTEIR